MYAFNLYHSKTLPYISENFVGREVDMKEVTQLINFKSGNIRIVDIIGPPGFGKSTLAILDMKWYGKALLYIIWM